MGPRQDRRRGMGRRCSDVEATVAVRRFLDDLGHELSLLSALVELVRDADVDAITRNQIDLIEQETERLCALVRDRVVKAPEPGILHVRPLLEQLVSLTAASDGVQVLFSSENDVRMRIDGRLLWRMVSNLLENAIRAAGPRGRVEVVASGGQDVLIEIGHDAPGGKPSANGSSPLALSLVSGLARACGGRLVVRAADRGTYAQLVFPGRGVARGVTAENSTAVIDLVIGDDHTLFGEALAGVLTTNSFSVRAVTRSISGVIEAVRRYRPDVCLLDRHFVDGDALDALDEIFAASARTRVLILTADSDMDGVTRALRAGAQGYVHKSSGFGALADAITRIMDDGGVVVEVPRQRARKSSPELAEARRLAAGLTARERECLELIVDGLSTDAMAKRLGVSHTTVRTHSQRLLTKLGVHSRLEAASFAMRYSLLDRPRGA